MLFVLYFVHFVSDWAKILTEMSATIYLVTWEINTYLHSEEDILYLQVLSECLSVLSIFVVQFKWNCVCKVTVWCCWAGLWMLIQERPYLCCWHAWNYMMLAISVWIAAHVIKQFLEYIFGAFVQSSTFLLTVLPISSAATKIIN